MSEEQEPYLTFELPKYQSKMIWWDESIFVVQTAKKCPNWWWRMWQYLLMGIRWEKING